MSLPVKQGCDFILQKVKVSQIYNHTIIDKINLKALTLNYNRLNEK